ncbi:MAG: N-acetylmuramoyl-L-alanine amidase [Gemmatimonadota bacterium]|nr:MAG: N-acetylmuramoyl-L-alanine amidase [Gemmatimonadota bacterium]
MTVNVGRSLELPESEYFAEQETESGITLHHTVCNDAHTTVRPWRGDKTAAGTTRRVATAYVIDRDGTVFELFGAAGVGLVVGRVIP